MAGAITAEILQIIGGAHNDPDSDAADLPGAIEMTTVAIIGAGCAGLAAAKTLLDHGGKSTEVILIDALARLGGRVWTDTSQGFPFDRGAEAIEGAEGNPWVKIAEENQVTTVPWSPSSIYRFFDGAVWQDVKDPPGVQPVELVKAQLEKSYEAHEESESKNLPAMYQIPATDAAPCLALGSSNLGSMGESVEPWQYIASDRARQKGNGETLFVNGGFGALVEKFGEGLQKNELLRTIFDKAVTCVRNDPDKGKLEILAGYEPLCKADYCIVSVPCSVLPRIALIPPFDQQRVVANGYIELGSYKKIAFKLKTELGDIKAKTEYFLYDDVMKGCWQYFMSPTVKDVLIGVASGNFAARLDRLADGAASKAFIDALNKAYAPAKIEPNTEPIVTNWSNQPHIWGSYSHTRYDGGDPDDPTAFQARVEIGKPHAEGRIAFAGEATCVDAYGTAHGAYRSGERAAKQILNSCGLM